MIWLKFCVFVICQANNIRADSHCGFVGVREQDSGLNHPRSHFPTSQNQFVVCQPVLVPDGFGFMGQQNER